MEKSQRHRLLILACSATKRNRPGWIPAVDRYDGPLWQTLRSIGPDRHDTKVAVLSARFGFIDSQSPNENYDTRLTPAVAERMIEVGIATRWPRPPIYRDCATCGMASLTDHGDRPFTEIAVVGGHLYLKVLRSFVGEFQSRNFILDVAPVTEINAPIGFMRRDLRLWLEHRPRDLPRSSRCWCCPPEISSLRPAITH